MSRRILQLTYYLAILQACNKTTTSLHTSSEPTSADSTAMEDLTSILTLTLFTPTR
jgi:hypothetical protein